MDKDQESNPGMETEMERFQKMNPGMEAKWKGFRRGIQERKRNGKVLGEESRNGTRNGKVGGPRNGKKRKTQCVFHFFPFLGPPTFPFFSIPGFLAQNFSISFAFLDSSPETFPFCFHSWIHLLEPFHFCFHSWIPGPSRNLML